MKTLQTIILGSAAVLLIAAAALYGTAYWRMHRVYDFPADNIEIPADAISVAEGKRLYSARQCIDCHMSGFEGKITGESFLIGRLVVPNLTGGAGSRRPTAAEIVRAVRHGVGEDGRPLAFMPSNEYAHLSDDELAKIISYINTLPAVDKELPGTELGPGPILLVALGLPGALPVERINHAINPSKVVKAEPTEEFGRYLSRGCHHCHGVDLGGQKMMGEAPGTPRAPNITFDRKSGIGKWNKDEFFRAMRQGVRPDGRVLDRTMPWPSFSQMTDVELDALWLYLQSFPPVEQ